MPLFSTLCAVEYCNKLDAYLPVMGNQEDMRNILQECTYLNGYT